MIEAFVDIETGDVVARSVDDLRKRVADRVTLPVRPSREDLEALGFQGVRIGRAPDYNPDTHDVRLSTVYDVRKGRWMPAWAVVEREDARERLRDRRMRLAHRALKRGVDIVEDRIPLRRRVADLERWASMQGQAVTPEESAELDGIAASWDWIATVHETARAIAEECRRGQYDDTGDPASDPRFDRFTKPEGR